MFNIFKINCESKDICKNNNNSYECANCLRNKNRTPIKDNFKPLNNYIKPKCKHINESGFSTIVYDSSYEMRSSDMHCELCGKEGSREELEKDRL